MQTQRITNGSKPLTQAFLIPLGQRQDETYEIQEFVTIGRDRTNQVIINDPFVSSRHARIEKRRQGYLIRDMHSSNGTTVNGTYIVEAFLKNNDKVMIGEQSFMFSKFNQTEKNLDSRNEKWNEQLKRLPAFANTDHTLLITGPSGSGKEILAQWVHSNSARRNAAYVTINCSALSESLIESELFGHVRGSFTGATEDRRGAFEAARGGSLFLDEIGDLPLSLQPKLLRALENKEIRPVGSDKTIKTNVRIISATHINLWERVQKKEFREDLYHRLNICRLSPPSLIDRMEDFEALLYSISRDNRVGFSFHAIEKLKNHSWPGNIRELKNLIIRAGAYFPGKRIQSDDIDQLLDVHNQDQSFPIIETDLPPLKQIERELLIQTLTKYHGNQRRAADELKMPKSTYHDKLKNYKIDPNKYKKRSRFSI